MFVSSAKPEMFLPPESTGSKKWVLLGCAQVRGWLDGSGRQLPVAAHCHWPGQGLWEEKENSKETPVPRRHSSISHLVISSLLK